MNQQLNLFEVKPDWRVNQPQPLVMSQEAIQRWKAKIFKHQQQTLQAKAPQQTNLFDTPSSHYDTNTINPFELKLHSSLFYRMPEQGDNFVKLR